MHSSLQGPGSRRAVCLPSVTKQALGQASEAQLFQSRDLAQVIHFKFPNSIHSMDR